MVISSIEQDQAIENDTKGNCSLCPASEGIRIYLLSSYLLSMCEECAEKYPVTDVTDIYIPGDSALEVFKKLRKNNGH
mgnify:FL=1